MIGTRDTPTRSKKNRPSLLDSKKTGTADQEKEGIRSTGADSVCARCFFECSVSELSHRTISTRRIVRTWEKGEYLFYAGEEAHGVWSVCRGRVKVFKETEDGKQLTIRIAIPGDLVGHRSLLAGTPLSGYGVATEDAVTAYLPAAVVINLIENDSKIRTQIIHKLAEDLGHAETLATSMAYDRAEERLMAAFVELCRNTDGCIPDEPFELEAPRQELAELAGLTVETTVRTLRRLEQAGVVKAHGRFITIINCDLLAGGAAP